MFTAGVTITTNFLATYYKTHYIYLPLATASSAEPSKRNIFAIASDLEFD